MCCLEYVDIPDIFLMSQYSCWHQQATNEINSTTIVSKATIVFYVTVALMWPNVIVETALENSDFLLGVLIAWFLEKNTTYWQTDIEELLRCSLLTLEREWHPQIHQIGEAATEFTLWYGHAIRNCWWLHRKCFGRSQLKLVWPLFFIPSRSATFGLPWFTLHRKVIDLSRHTKQARLCGSGFLALSRLTGMINIGDDGKEAL
jgi:hypothetical protein